ncbi:MAG: 16S rRNA (cytosine(1402)-N(4))-methyltransferase RsmH [Phycisphaerales bacterium]|nr:16S rRNA (cytosine(1402)-N(4))-methyltransferase RsmH [Phycisphaerales bacterium]
MRHDGHIPVLLDSTLGALALRPGETALDCTAGLGGHAAAMAAAVGPSGVVVLNDADPSNLALAEARLRGLEGGPRVVAMRGNFADAPRRLAELGLRAHAVLADLGFASTQVEDASRGLSFQRDGPLDMRFDPASPTTAADLVNTLGERELVEILRDFGEERDAPRIARKIVEERSREPITTTARLADIVRTVSNPRRTAGTDRTSRSGPARIDPATRTFQALRIVVNDELGSLTMLLDSIGRASAALASGAASGAWLHPGARIAIIAFHSLEDRLVKRAFDEWIDRGWARAIGPGAGSRSRPVEATEDEERRNPRSRSAKLRAIRIGPEVGR